MTAVDAACPAFTAVVPVRPWRLAPTSLAVEARDRLRLARAFTLDVLRALQETPSVSAILIVSDERDFPPEALGAHVTILDDRALMSADPINHAIRVGGRWAVARYPDRPAVVVPADLASITGAVLEATLEQMRTTAPRSFVADLAGGGTTLVAVADPHDLVTFGTGPAGRHPLEGFVQVGDAATGARLDVDTLRDLRHAASHGVGPLTQAALAQMSRPVAYV